MPLGGTGRTQYSFKLQAGQHIGKTGVRKRIITTWIVRDKPGRYHQGPNPNLVGLGLLLEIHCAGGTKFLAGLALPPFLKIDTMLGINNVLEGNGLGVWDICGFSLAQPGIV
jgi:hypothetical protein